jgi:DNA-binding CsgD family transcriptional regulator
MISERTELFPGNRPQRDSNGRNGDRLLTNRELEVLELVAQGYSTREIARKLWVTDETVKTHVRRVLRRLGARTRAHAVAIAFGEGLWEVPGPARRGGRA